MTKYTSANVFRREGFFSFEIKGIPRHQKIIFEGFMFQDDAESAMREFIKLNRIKKVRFLPLKWSKKNINKLWA